MAEENSSDEDNDPEDAEVPRLKLQPRHLQQLLCPFLEAAGGEDTGGQSKIMGAHLQQRQRKKFLEVEYRRSMEITRPVWSTDAHHRETGARNNPGQIFAKEYQEHLRAIAQKAGTSRAPFDAQRNAAASWNQPGAR